MLLLISNYRSEHAETPVGSTVGEAPEENSDTTFLEEGENCQWNVEVKSTQNLLKSGKNAMFQ